MTSQTSPVAADIAALEPIAVARRRWPMWLGALLTLAMVIGLGRALFDNGLAGLARTVPRDPRFYVAFGLLYMSPPTFDFLIFRRLWRVPGAALGALVRKRVANEVVLGYSGDAYFYAWARARMKLVAAPFGAVKDVTILSALAGNGMTLALMALAVPVGYALVPADKLNLVLGSAAVTVAISLPFLLFSKRVFSLPRPTLWWIFGMHCLRLVTGSLLIALAWHFALPGVALGVWLLLAAARLLVSRLPLLPNKDLLFANFAILVLGTGALGDLLAFTAALTLLVHVAMLAGFGVSSLVGRARG